ncbi:MAG: hypothetical protein KDK89_16435 [Alphaproteobacteria bacterium]|nr:hypothetical protein [Alphaproteobacteria bacterium]
MNLTRHIATALLVAIAVAGGLGPAAKAEATSGHQIVTLPDVAPERSGNRQPSSKELIETWLAGYGWNDDKHFDQERYEIVAHRVTWKDLGRAFLQFRILPLEGDAMSLAQQRCPGRDKPIEIQIYYQWTEEDIQLWTALENRGDPGFDQCSDDLLWTGDQIDKIVNPPPLPPIPVIKPSDVETPPPGSPLRKSILDGLRPLFEDSFGKPVVFKVDEMRVAAGTAWLLVHPERPGGKQISAAEWNAVTGFCDQDIATVSSEFWMRERNGTWEVGWGNGFCASDSIGQMGYLIGAPPQIVDLDEWPSTDFMPVGDPQYFKLWWP